MWMVQYLRDYQTFIGTARYWTETFAKASSLGVEEKVCCSLSLSLSLPTGECNLWERADTYLHELSVSIFIIEKVSSSIIERTFCIRHVNTFL